MENEVLNFKLWLERLGYAKETISSYTRLLYHFFKYLNGEHPTQKHIVSFNKHLHSTKISSSYISTHINVIRQYSRYLETVQNTKLMVGAVHIDRELYKERTIFSLGEIRQLFEATTDTPQGLYDKALLNLYYGCGLRCKEGILLTPKDVDYTKGLLYVKPSKNYQSRYVPMSIKVMQDLQDYQLYAREKINSDSPYLLVGKINDHTNGQYLNRRLKKLLEITSIQKQTCLHSLRHSIATHLLEQGMDIEYIGRFLGHKTLAATQIYVRISMENSYV